MSECNHVVGFMRASYPQHGESDRLVLLSEGASDIDEEFAYCPLCGAALAAPRDTAKEAQG